MKKNGFAKHHTILGFAPVLIILVIPILGVVGYFVYKSYLPQSPNIPQTYTPPATVIPDLTVGWKTYENQDAGFSVKYPGDFIPTKNTEANVAKFESNDYNLDFEVAEFSKYESWIELIKKDLASEELNVRNQKIFDKDAYLESRQSSGSIFERNIFIVNGTSIIRISVSADENKVSEVYNKVESLADQILSTFKSTK